MSANVNGVDKAKLVPAVAILILGSGLGAYRLWEHATAAGWIPRDHLATIIANNWSTGEYKNCQQAIIPDTKDGPQIDCSSYAGPCEPKVFQVRFYGQTYRENLKNKASLAWRRKKNDGIDPAFTCDQAEIVRWK